MAKKKDDFISGSETSKLGYIKLFEHKFSEYIENEEEIKKLEERKQIVLSKDENVTEMVDALGITGYDHSYNYILGIKRLAQTRELIICLTGAKDYMPDDVYYHNINLSSIYNYLESCGTLKEYMNILSELRERENTRKAIFDSITLEMGCECKNQRSNRVKRHHFVRTQDELKCVCCGVSTKDYDLSNEELDFLTECAKDKKSFVCSVPKKYVPFLQVLNETGNSCTFEDTVENRIIFARSFDKQAFGFTPYTYNNRKFLEDNSLRRVMLALDKQIEEAKKSKSRHRNLMIEALQTRKYEFLLLNCGDIPTLYKNANKAERYALAKAYYYLLNKETRNEHFYSNYSSDGYNHITTNEGLNRKVLEMLPKTNG